MIELLNKALIRNNSVLGINGEILKESIEKGVEELLKDLKAIAEQSHNPACERKFGKELMEICKAIVNFMK